jgi:hypothetical protein
MIFSENRFPLFRIMLQAALSDPERLIERVSRRGNRRQIAAEISTSTLVSMARVPLSIVIA